MERSRAVVDRLAAGDDPIYAVNTGVGLLADVRIPRERIWTTLQSNVVRSHAAGVRRAARARSGARYDADSRQRARQRILRHSPVDRRPLLRDVGPMRRHPGGAFARAASAHSGDLAPLAHMALVLIGEGEAEFSRARVIEGGEALRRAGIEPIELHPKEGISA
jgi:histidine ammonia-lyase